MHIHDRDEVSSWLKTLLVLALMVPMTAYVAGSLVSAGGGEPADRSPVIIEDRPSPTPERPRRTPVEPIDGPEGHRQDQVVPAETPPPAPTVMDDDDDDHIRHDGVARVVTPEPTPVDPEDEHEGPRGGRDDDTTDEDADDDEDADHDRGGDDDATDSDSSGSGSDDVDPDGDDGSDD